MSDLSELYMPTPCRVAQTVPLTNQLVFQEAAGEEQLFEPLLNWLIRTRRASAASLLIREFPWHTRHVDVAILSTSGLTTSIEMKLNDNLGAVRQAARNALAFDRNWICIRSRPSTECVHAATEVGVGILRVRSDGSIKPELGATPTNVEAAIRRSLRTAISERSTSTHDVPAVLPLPRIRVN